MALLHAFDKFEPASQLEVRLLGGFSVSINGAEVAAERWPSLRAAQLVQLLSLVPQRRMSRDRVVDTLWPQLEPDAGAANLRKAAHYARQALGRHDGVVLHGGEVVLWAHGCVAVDVDRFEELAQAALAGSEREACTHALDAYAGDLLPALPTKPGLNRHANGCTRVSSRCCGPALSGNASPGWSPRMSSPTAN